MEINMAWWEYIPIVKTIGHIVGNPKGRQTSDYSGCRCSSDDCEADEVGAILKCTDCIKFLCGKYAADWTGSAIGNDFFEAAAAAGAAGIGGALAKILGGTFLGLSASAWTGIGAVLLVDSLVDAGVVIKKLMDMYTAARNAITLYCKC